MKAVMTNKHLLYDIKKNIEDLRCDVNQLQNKNNLHIYNPIDDFGFEMPFNNMDDFLTFDGTLTQKNTSDKFVRFFSHNIYKKRDKYCIVYCILINLFVYFILID